MKKLILALSIASIFFVSCGAKHTASRPDYNKVEKSYQEFNKKNN